MPWGASNLECSVAKLGWEGGCPPPGEPPPGQAVILGVLHYRNFQPIIEFYKGIPFIRMFQPRFVFALTRGDPREGPPSKKRNSFQAFFLW